MAQEILKKIAEIRGMEVWKLEREYPREKLAASVAEDAEGLTPEQIAAQIPAAIPLATSLAFVCLTCGFLFSYA
ncbi:MAG: hypothetical protein LBS51_08580 [Oscillospiraceae bacterium]|jgi:hypothetical protein|nr:hypothetical protein [Oscillospiraceae bacterium]